MASRNYTPNLTGRNNNPRHSPEQHPNPPHGLQAHPLQGGGPFFLPERDSPATLQVRPYHGAGDTAGRGVARSPDRLHAVGVGVGDASPRALDTTAQLDQSPAKQPNPTPVGTGSGTRDALRRRARAKGFSNALADGLAGLGDATPLRHSYLATLACAGTLRQDDGAITGKYCNNRWCVVCNRIRTAKLWQAYGPELSAWGDAQLVTLTLPNVKGTALHSEVRRLLKAFTAVKRGVKRTDGLPFKAVRKLEVTYNRQRRDYHPHLHLLVNGSVVSQALVKRWLALHPDASPSAQDIRPATNPAELFKYVTKLCTKVDGKHSAYPPVIMDTIFKAVRGLRTFQSVGFTLPPNLETVGDDDGTLKLDASTPAPLQAGPTDWHWIGGAVQDWVNLETGEVLADHTPTPTYLRLLDNVRLSALPDDGGGG